MFSKDQVPEDLQNDKTRKATTIGELRAAIADLPDDAPLTIGFSDAIELSVIGDSDNLSVMLDEAFEDDDDDDEWEEDEDYDWEEDEN